MIDIIKKWFLHIFSKDIVNIIKGNFYRLINKGDSLYLLRYNKYCKSCTYIELTPIGEVCGICGCPLKSKLRIKDAKCEIAKW